MIRTAEAVWSRRALDFYADEGPDEEKVDYNL